MCDLAGATTFRAYIDDPVGLGNHIQAVFARGHAVAAIDQAVQHADQLFHIRHVHLHTGFAQHGVIAERWPRR